MRHRLTAAAILTLVFAALAVAAAPAEPTVPAVLEPLKAKVGGHYAFKGTTLSFRAEQTITEEQWTALEGLGVHQIVTGGKGMDDAAIARLVKLDPQGLVLDGSTISDDGCKYLAEMKSLRSLSVGHTSLGKDGFEGRGFAQLKTLPNLEKLSFGGTGAGDPAMEGIGELSQLKEFGTGHTHFTVASNSALLKLTNLTTLSFGNSMPAWDGKPRRLSLDDSTLAIVAQMKSLEHITFSQAIFTLPALEQLKSLTKLKTLQLNSIEIDPADIEKLRGELPAVKIEYKPLSADEKTKLDDFLTHR